MSVPTILTYASCSFPCDNRQKQRHQPAINNSTKSESVFYSPPSPQSKDSSHSRLPKHSHPSHLPHPTINSPHTRLSPCAPEESAATRPAPTASTRRSKKNCVSRKAPSLFAVLGSGCSSTSFPTVSLALVNSVLRPLNARWHSRMVVVTRRTFLSDVTKVCLHVGVVF
jgi:hypothetical protein